MKIIIIAIILLSALSINAQTQNTGCAKALFNDQINDSEKPFVISDDKKCIIINAEIAVQNKIFDFTRNCSDIANSDNGGNGIWFVTTSCITRKSRVILTYRFSENAGQKGLLSVQMVNLGNGLWGFNIYSHSFDGKLNTTDNHEINWLVIN